MRMEPIKDLIWPGAVVAFMVGAGHVFCRGLDTKYGWNSAFRRSQDWFHVLVMGGGLYGVGTAKSKDAMEASVAAVYGDLPLLGESIAATVFSGVLRRRGAAGAAAARALQQAAARRMLPAGRGVAVAPIGAQVRQLYQDELIA